ncbi:MAG: divergent polysaccharide deacetylase family protein [Bacillota bacterium]|nr:divergent polysaccharide deacetylase family protein [Bacillota bacterium]
MKKLICFLFPLFLFSLLMQPKISFAQAKVLKAAIIIDDFGGCTGGVEKFLDGDIRITAAVMPFTDHSTEHAKWAHKNGFEVMIHLPMQPIKGKRSWLGPKPITVDLSPKEVKEIVYEAIKNVPFAKGLNNHMGSLAVTNEEIVRAIVEVAKEKNLFIVDSGTSPNSKFPEISTELGVPLLKRDVFLDDISSPTHVRRQMERLAKITELKGKGLAIGHVGIKGDACSTGVFQSMEMLKNRNIKIVPVSELLAQDLMKKNILP